MKHLLSKPITLIIIVVVVVLSFFFFRSESVEVPQKQEEKVQNFVDCVAAGNDILESYPAQCVHEGKTFVQQLRTDVSVEEAQGLIEKNSGSENFVILDVRTPKEFQGGHIEGATNMDFRSDSFEEMLETLDRQATYLVYCGSGMRSESASELMSVLEFGNVNNMVGGISAWEQAGYEVKK